MKKFKPITPGLRHRLILSSSDLKDGPFKPLIEGKRKTGFRNNFGRITIRHRGGGHKTNFRFLDINRINCNHSPFQIVRIEKDPNRSSYIALCKSIEGVGDGVLLLKKEKISVRIKGHKYFYILAPHSLIPGSIISPNFISIGSTLALVDIPLGSLIHNVELNGNNKIARAAGTYCTVISHNFSSNTSLIKLPSKKLIELPNNNKATIGIVSNIDNNKKILGKAGASR
jgi:large subunit ribosomal protein L2